MAVAEAAAAAAASRAIQPISYKKRVAVHMDRPQVQLMVMHQNIVVYNTVANTQAWKSIRIY